MKDEQQAIVGELDNLFHFRAGENVGKFIYNL